MEHTYVAFLIAFALTKWSRLVISAFISTMHCDIYAAWFCLLLLIPLTRSCSVFSNMVITKTPSPPSESPTTNQNRGHPFLSMGIDINEFVHPKTISSQLMCSICGDVLHKPVMTQCEHLFCEDELLEWLTQKPESPTCPADNLAINPKLIKKPR
jgi:hypothetical protein